MSAVKACTVLACALVCSVQAFVPSLQAGRVDTRAAAPPHVARTSDVAPFKPTPTVNMYTSVGAKHTRGQRTELNARVGRYSAPDEGGDVTPSIQEEPKSKLGRLRRRINTWAKRVLFGQEDQDQAEYEAAMAAYASRASATQQAKAASLETEKNPRSPTKAPPKKNSKGPSAEPQRRRRPPADSPPIVHMDVSKQGSPEDEDMMADLRRRLQFLEQKRAAEEAKNSSNGEDADEDSDSSASSSKKPTQRRDPGSQRKGRPSSNAGSAVLSRPDRPDGNTNSNNGNTGKSSNNRSERNQIDSEEGPEVVRFASSADIERLNRMFGNNNSSSSKGQN